MKTKLTMLAVVWALMANAQTAITLSSSNFTVKARTETQIDINPATTKVPSTGANQNWDYSKPDTTNYYQFGYIANSNSAFPSTAIADTALTQNLVPNGVFYYNIEYGEDASGFNFLGVYTDKQVYPIGALTGNSGDSLLVKAGSQVFPTAVPALKFPATMGDKWQSNYSTTFNFGLTLPAYSLNNANLQFSSYYSRTSEVVGWGNVTLPGNGSKGGSPLSVLLVKRVSVETDSFRMPGQSPILLAGLMTAFQISQGQKSVNARYYMYSASDQSPVMLFNFGSDTTFKHPSLALFDAEDAAAGIENNKAANINYILYPNPATENNVNVSFTKTDAGKWAIAIADISGKTILRVPVTQVNGEVKMNLTLPTMQNGTYFLTITNENGENMGSSKLTVLTK